MQLTQIFHLEISLLGSYMSYPQLLEEILQGSWLNKVGLKMFSHMMLFCKMQNSGNFHPFYACVNTP